MRAIFSAIVVGALVSVTAGYTYPASSTTTATTTTTSSSSTSTATGTVFHWGQCGGIGWTGGTVCQPPAVCTVMNDWFSQCI